jgi:hypothetical protein
MMPSRGMGVMAPSKIPRAKRRGDSKPVIGTGKPIKTFKGGGLYENIHKKRARIAAGSGERMRKPGSAGAPTAEAFRQSAKTAKR